ncbi:MAG: PQQ-dependent sugar dehydrogenase, partial [Phycisphaeraceae bacterium]|nr:PQQ-dependent sugar dehydrogenase [Phycisphaeraceae bacterium]
MRIAWMLIAACVLGPKPSVQAEPKPTDPRLRLSLFAEHPTIVTPTGLCIDASGAVLVIENHTHFPPPQYDGRKTDRILRLNDTDGDGRADQTHTFHDGFRDGMDLTVGPDGAVYLATRRSIVRLEDADRDGRAEKSRIIVTLKTKGNYPHNGLSGLCFDDDGTLHFGFGENLGEPYELIGADGTRLHGGGEGGSTYRVLADGSNLRRISTGYWNPFGMCFDVWGNLFAVDNDPDASPPCRLIHVVEGGDYGYQYRYGRSGLSPLHAWDGQLPGTLPMVAGTGEAPCGILAYESTGLPAEYRGQLLVASWGDHRIERYELKRHGAGFRAGRSVLVRGGGDFRPVDLAVGHNGVLYFSDWVDRSYKLHGKGRIWRLSWKGAPSGEAPGPLAEQLKHPDRRRRETAARALARSGPEGLRKLIATGTDPNQPPRVRVSSLRAAAIADPKRAAPVLIEQLKDPKLSADAKAALVRWLPEGEADHLLKADWPAPVRLANAPRNGHPQRLLEALDDPDPFLRAAASANPEAILWLESESSIQSARQRIGLLQALGHAEGRDTLLKTDMVYLLESEHNDVRIFALRLIAEGKQSEYRPEVQKLLDDPDTPVQTATVAFATLAYLEDRSVDGRGARKLLRSIAIDS